MKNVKMSLLLLLLTACGSDGTQEPILEKTAGKITLSSFSITSSSTSATKTPTIKWTESTRLVATKDLMYKLIVATDSNCEDSIEVKEVKETSASLSSLANGSYYLCLSANLESTKEEASNSPLAFKIEASEEKEMEEAIEPVVVGGSAEASSTKLSAFALLAPSSLTIRNPVLSWNASTNATSYDVKVCADADCAIVEQTYTDQTSTSLTLTATVANHLKDGTHFVKVTAKNTSESLNAEVSSWTMDVPSLASFGFDITRSVKNYGTDASVLPLNQWSQVTTSGVSFISLVLSNSQCYGFEDGIACIMNDNSYRSYSATSGSRFDWTY